MEEEALKRMLRSPRIGVSQVQKGEVFRDLREGQWGHLGMTVRGGRLGFVFHGYPFVRGAVHHLYRSVLHLCGHRTTEVDQNLLGG